MSAAGKVTIGFSKPYVAHYSAAGGVITLSDARILARGVSVNLAPNSGNDNVFRADNQDAESEGGVFTGGNVTLTVDGLFVDAERFIMGLPETGADGWTPYGDNQAAPYCAIGYIVKSMSDGIQLYTPTVIIKTKFTQLTNAAETQQQTINWQTQELTATVLRADDANHNWKFIGSDFTTEEEAEVALQTKLGIEQPAPTYTVTFDSNGGSAVDPQIVTSGDTATEPTAPTKTGETFDGWYSDDTLTTAFVFTTPITADITLYAKWTTGV